MQVERLAPGYSDAVYAVFPAGDSVWVGTPIGLLLAVPDGQDLLRPDGLTSPSYQAAAVDIATLGDTLVALTRDGLLWRDPRTRRWTLGANLSTLLGRLRRFVPDGAGFWVAGERGVGYARVNTPAVRSLSENDLPGPVSDLAIDEEYLWVATSRGLGRYRLETIRP
jgi:ligand-binding sensor domain-containing protein